MFVHLNRSNSPQSPGGGMRHRGNMTVFEPAANLTKRVVPVVSFIPKWPCVPPRWHSVPCRIRFNLLCLLAFTKNLGKLEQKFAEIDIDYLNTGAIRDKTRKKLDRPSHHVVRNLRPSSHTVYHVGLLRSHWELSLLSMRTTNTAIDVMLHDVPRHSP